MLVVSILLGWLVLTPALAQDRDRLTAGDIAGKIFRFSWESRDGGTGINGTLHLLAGGQIAQPHHPNETSWRIDEQGRLVLLDAAGRISTCFERAVSGPGGLQLEGPFLLREGIVHHFAEIHGDLSRTVPERIGVSRQRIFCLDPGEEHTVVLEGGRERTVRLLEVTEERDSVIDLVRRAEVRVTIDGHPVDLVCAPYVMPSRVDDLRIQADTTSAWVDLPARVQFSVWDAADPIVDPESFCFPLRDYRFLSHGLQCWNEPVHLGFKDGDPDGQIFYHNYGIDLAGFEGAEQVVSCTDGKIVRLHPPGDPWSVAIEDDSGLIWEYMHLDVVEPWLAPEVAIHKGERLGLLGKTGPSGNFSHLHVGLYLSRAHLETDRSCRRINLYPWMLQAYLQETGDRLLAVPGPHQAVLTGERVRFDGSASLAVGDPITSFRWEFDDGVVLEGARVERRFDHAGVFSAGLRVTTEAGREEIGFSTVKVYSAASPEPFLPTIFLTYTPTRELYAGQPVRVRGWLHSAIKIPIRLDFGDGGIEERYFSFREVVHRYAHPGHYLLSATARVGDLPICERRQIVVRPRPGGH